MTYSNQKDYKGKGYKVNYNDLKNQKIFCNPKEQYRLYPRYPQDNNNINGH